MPIRFFEQTIRVLSSAGETNGVLGALEIAGPAGADPPFHVHHREDEAFYILEGEYSVFIGERVITATPGTWVWGPRGVPHGYKVRSPQGRHLGLVMPGGFEEFFEEVSSIARPDADPQKEMEKISAVAARYGIEFVGSETD